MIDSRADHSAQRTAGQERVEHREKLQKSFLVFFFFFFKTIHPAELSPAQTDEVASESLSQKTESAMHSVTLRLALTGARTFSALGCSNSLE